MNFVRFAPPPALARFSERYDLVGFDPRGVGASSPAVEDCAPAYGSRFARPETLDRGALLTRARDHLRRCLAANRALLPYLTTANVARDLDRLRAAVGDARLNYLGVSYGGLIGETYTTLFPGRTGAIVLDSPVDGEAWIGQPLEGAREQSASFERSLDRFLHWCTLQFPGCTLDAGRPAVRLRRPRGAHERRTAPRRATGEPSAATTPCWPPRSRCTAAPAGRRSRPRSPPRPPATAAGSARSRRWRPDRSIRRTPPT